MFAYALVQRFKPLWEMVSTIIRRFFPSFATELSTVKEEYRLFDLFTLLIINLTCGGGMHKDCKDFKYCVVFTLGNFEEGMLAFPGLGYITRLVPGDLAVFESSQLLHGNMPYIGNRKSCVLVTHSTMIKYGK
jgi:hypothetical protein